MRSFFAFFGLFLTGFAQASVNVSPVEFVYRDPLNDGGTVVAVQGLRDGTHALQMACGSGGENCECLFLRSPTDRNPLKISVISMDGDNNVAYCSLGEVIEDATSFHFLILRNHGAQTVTDLQPIRTELTLQEVLGGNFAKQKVVGVYRYTCSRTFLEGEGVNAAAITCTAGQHLGLISASYSFYTYRSGQGGNVGGGDVAFPGPICDLNSLLKIQCSASTPELRFGFYSEAKAPFVVGVQMTRAPEAAPGDTNPLTSLYGYAALPSSGGFCPVGLVKARQWAAQPASITQGSLGNNPPSSFINQGNSLNDTQVEISQPANFLVGRQANATPCSGTGDCSNAAFAKVTKAESVPYQGLSPVLCVLPPNLLKGLF
jgi:hypothetical protein